VTDRPAPTSQEERKVVTVLFCDLVGFTSASEVADPEDTRGVLDSYFRTVRAQIEAHGGVVEKFIGDAAVGVFGVPASHEDDPERAVRAGLRILVEAERLAGVGGAPLRVRIGISTGEALVRLGVEPASGEGFLTGDTVNTAARLQAAAPEMAVAVGLSTYDATAGVFDYEELEPAALKGKAEPALVFVARATRSRLGAHLIRTHDTPYVGRGIDLTLLKGLFDKTVATSSVQLVTVVGEPGIGKSRIVAELLEHAQAREPRLTWRQGRCLPYGDGVTFWALGEIVKAQAGILESDDQEAASSKLELTVPDGVDREWMAQRLLPLVGVDVSSEAERDELFSAWRTFLETVAEESPCVLVFEDLHWADDGLLAFLEHLADRAEGVPLLVVGTARPELFERRATFAAGLPNVNRVNLAPLTDEETALLVSALLDSSEIPAELWEPIIERSEGNPLYAEEFVNLLKDQDLLVQKNGAWQLRAGARVPLPDSIQSLIAARLDTLPAQRKSLLADAAVIGKVFWAGAVAEMGDRNPDDVIDTLRELSRKELVRPARHSSMEGEAEYAFWHVLTRDVAYSQLPRASRAARHVAAATWLEAKAGERVDDIAEVLAYHYSTALELTRAAGHADRATDLEGPALRFLALAGERALHLDLVTACTSLRHALELAPKGHPERARLLALLARGEELAGRVAEAVRLYEEAIPALRESGSDAAADEAARALSVALANLGDFKASEALLDEMLDRLEGQGPSELLALVYCSKQYFHQEDQTWAEKALDIDRQLDLPRVRARALNMRGLGRAVNFADPDGISDLRAALTLSLEQQNTREAYTVYSNLAGSLAIVQPAAALEAADKGIAYAKARGLAPGVQAMRQWALLRLGRWDELLEAGQEVLSIAEALGDRWVTTHVAAAMALVLARRGAPDEAVDLARRFSNESTQESFFVPLVVAHRTAGRLEDAERRLEKAVQRWMEENGIPGWDFDLSDLAREATALGRPDLLESLLTLTEGEGRATLLIRTPWRALAAEAAGRHDDALALFRQSELGWRKRSDPYEQAHALLGQARCLITLDRPKDALGPLNEACVLFADLGAVPALAETRALLGEGETTAV
jgi:class 3 adenylate cyclase/tetratricopeptide (TPR) repeat protein